MIISKTLHKLGFWRPIPCTVKLRAFHAALADPKDIIADSSHWADAIAQHYAEGNHTVGFSIAPHAASQGDAPSPKEFVAAHVHFVGVEPRRVVELIGAHRLIPTLVLSLPSTDAPTEVYVFFRLTWTHKSANRLLALNQRLSGLFGGERESADPTRLVPARGNAAHYLETSAEYRLETLEELVREIRFNDLRVTAADLRMDASPLLNLEAVILGAKKYIAENPDEVPRSYEDDFVQEALVAAIAAARGLKWCREGQEFIRCDPKEVPAFIWYDALSAARKKLHKWRKEVPGRYVLRNSGLGPMRGVSLKAKVPNASDCDTPYKRTQRKNILERYWDLRDEVTHSAHRD